MIVELPTVEVTDEQYQRIFAAYRDRVYANASDEDIENAIRADYINAVNTAVINRESQIARTESDMELQDKLVALREGLPQPIYSVETGPTPVRPTP